MANIMSIVYFALMGITLVVCAMAHNWSAMVWVIVAIVQQVIITKMTIKAKQRAEIATKLITELAIRRQRYY